MKKFAALILFFCLVNIYSQTNSIQHFSEPNISFLDLYPLHIGDYWQYKITVDSDFNNEDTMYYAYREIIKDTLMSNGFVYKVVNDTRNYAWSYLNFIRVDSLTGCIYYYNSFTNEEFLRDSLKMMTGDMIETGFGYYVQCISVDSTIVFDEKKLTKNFYVLVYPNYFEYKYSEGIGEIYRFDYRELIVRVETTSEITYAKIDGHEFGRLVNVIDAEKLNVSDFRLKQNYPNPFNPTTNIRFWIADFGFVSLKVYDVLGNEVATLVNEEKPAGEYEVEFDGSSLTSGIYFYQLKAGSFIQTKKMILLK